MNHKTLKNNCHPEAMPKDLGTHHYVLRDSSRSLRMTSETGRSMVEMLGVLAIMGLLTIIGIAGFKIAMNKAKANSLVADMNRLAHIVVMDKFSGYGADAINRAVEEHNQDTEYPATCNSTFKSTMFSLTLKNPIDKEMCEQVANLGWAVPQGVFLNEVEKETLQAEDCADSNTLTWVFMDDLSHCADCVLSEVRCSDYGINGHLECGSCSDLRGYTRDDAKCANSENGQYCVLGNCESCPPGQTVYNNDCKACSTITDLVMSADDCHKCVDTENKPTHFVRIGGGNHCTPCDNYDNWGAYWETTLAECNRCSNRCFRQDSQRCGVPGYINRGGKNFVGYKRDNKTGYCVKDNCPTGQTFNQDNNCTSCSAIDGDLNNASVEDCHKCVDANNNPTHFIRIGDGNRCFPCDNYNNYGAYHATSLEECNHCSNRCLRPDNNTCGVPGYNNKGMNFIGYKLDPKGSGYCVCDTGYHMNAQNQCVAD